MNMNPAAENLLGISVQRARRESLLRLVDDEPELRDILGRVMVTGDHYANELHLAPTEVHAEERIVDCRVSPLDVGAAALLVEMADVTRRSRISRENALLIQHGAGRQMIRQLAHEIKNPLGGIRGAAQLLERQLALEDVALGQPDVTLHVQGRHDLAVQDDVADVRCALGDDVDDGVAEGLAPDVITTVVGGATPDPGTGAKSRWCSGV